MSSKKDKPENSNDEKKQPEEPKEQLSQTQHSIIINGQEIAYTATAGTMIIREEDEEGGQKAKASIFFVAYTLDGVDDPASRPLTFSFNGGPGSSSVWLHLGLLGPRRTLMGQDGEALPPPYRLVDNEHSLLDVTDLVFIDPVSTGYSRAVEGEKAKEFHDFEKDIESVAEFIRLYTTRYQRWASAKFLIGESYGTTRAAGLAGQLQNQHGMYLNGLMLISSILNFQTAYFKPGNDLPYSLFLPTYCATAWYHKQLSAARQQDLRQTLAEVEAFAEGEYTLALMKGNKLTSEERQEIAQKLADYTGLSQEYIERSNLRINIHRFVKELLRQQRRTVGRLDSRFIGMDRDAVGQKNEYDPSYALLQAPYTATLNDYMRRDLEFESDLPYEILTARVQPWSYKAFQNHYVDVAETLREAMCKNPFLKVFVANGYYDLATPYFATQYTFNHLDLDVSRQENISMAYYEAGHMMYIHQPSLAELKKDLAEFVSSSH